jgi:hypothetical protein
VIAANVIDRLSPGSTGEPRAAETQLAAALTPFGLEGRAVKWLAWADESVRAAA